jgi:hypothetical protein
MDIIKARQILNIFQDGFLGDDLLKLSNACDDLKSFINKQAETITEADKVIKMLSDKLAVYENCDTCGNRINCRYPKDNRCALYER